MPQRAITTDRAPAAVGPYSQAIECDGWLFSSGQIPLDPDTGKLVPGGVEAQAEQVLQNLRAVLQAAGGDLSDVCKATLFVTDLSNFGAINAVYERFLGDLRPARSTVQVAALPLGASIEIEIIARIPV